VALRVIEQVESKPNVFQKLANAVQEIWAPKQNVFGKENL
jgi:hypothetical protein